MRRQEAEEGKHQRKEGGGRDKTRKKKDVRGQRGDKWRRAELLKL